MKNFFLLFNKNIMISYMITKWWNKNGWSIIFICSLVIIFILWIFVAGKNSSSSETNFGDAMNMMVSPQVKSSISSTKSMFHTMKTGEIPIPIKEYEQRDSEFIYENGTSKGENECRRIMQELTGRKFYKVRPDFMKDPVTGIFLELDCYNEELKLAIEYNGRQHDEYNSFMHQGSKDKFRNQQYRDYLKKDLCKKNSVYLIVVPHTVKLRDLHGYLIEKLEPYLKERLG